MLLLSKVMSIRTRTTINDINCHFICCAINKNSYRLDTYVVLQHTVQISEQIVPMSIQTLLSKPFLYTELRNLQEALKEEYWNR